MYPPTTCHMECTFRPSQKSNDDTRLVQCDELRPACGPCKKVGRECEYTYGHAEKFVNYGHHEGPSASPPRATSGDARREPGSRDKKHKPKDREMVLSLRSSRNVQSGESLMQTFHLAQASGGGNSAASRPGTNADAGSAPETSLLALWLSYVGLGPEESSLYCSGDWVDAVQRYIGRSEVVDAAVMSLVSGAVAFGSREGEDITTARETNISALQTLRLSLSKDSQGAEGSRGPLVATKLLYIAEVGMVGILFQQGLELIVST